MILVDTSVWVHHLQQGDVALAKLLTDGRVLCHPFVCGELALGHLKQRELILDALQNLPQAQVASAEETLTFISAHTLHGIGIGIGYVDVHLLASTRLTPGVTLWTLDKRLAAAAERLGVAANLLH